MLVCGGCFPLGVGASRPLPNIVSDISSIDFKIEELYIAYRVTVLKSSEQMLCALSLTKYLDSF